MKKFLFIAVAFLLSLTAGAQDVFKGYNRVEFGYYGTLLENAGDFHGFRAGYMRGFNLKSTLPLFLETGPQMVYGINTDGYENVDFIRVAMPLNVTYRFCKGSDWKISPYTGFAVAVNCMLKGRDSGTSLFDGEYGASRVQGTWQVGCNFSYKRMSLGVEYGIDLNKFMYKTNSMHLAMNAGVEF